MKTGRLICLIAAIAPLASSLASGSEAKTPSARPHQILPSAVKRMPALTTTTPRKIVVPSLSPTKSPPALPVTSGQRRNLTSVGGPVVAQRQNTTALNGSKLKPRP